ncbi:MAG: protein phosphatase 2C domain-containing protein [Pseudomonadota bacterium]
MRLSYTGALDKGLVRAEQQDAIDLPGAGGREPWLLLLADGMGGAAGGAIASRLGLERIRQVFDRSSGENNPERALIRAVQAANQAVYEKAQAQPELAGMGTTLVALWVGRDQARLAWVGDSRCYLWRGGSLRQLSRDHSWVAQQVAQGLLTPAQAAHHTMRNVLTRALGAMAEVSPETLSLDLLPGDLLLLCSDGLHGVVPEAELARSLAAGKPLAQTAAGLIALARQAGAPDNVSVVLARVDETGSASAGPGETTQTGRVPRGRAWLKALILGGALLAAAGAAWWGLAPEQTPANRPQALQPAPAR